MTIFCTYCSNQKIISSEILPAVKRYQSQRIESIHKAATTIGLPLFILSGKFGLISANEEIEYYDHLLIESEVPDHAILVSQQLVKHKINDIVFYSNTVESDPKILPYLNCMRKACELATSQLKFIYVSLPE